MPAAGSILQCLIGKAKAKVECKWRALGYWRSGSGVVVKVRFS